MRLLLLFWKLLRYRVAVMLILFMLLAAAIHHGITLHPVQLTLAALALAFSYVSATSSNDIADEKIDSINHPNSPGRPLINGSAHKKDMWIVFGTASTLSILLCVFIDWRAVAVIVISLLINVLYSLPPVRLSYRTFLAPLALGIAYVGVPYILALTVLKTTFLRHDVIWLAGLYLMFVGRIILKDFRDRKGDSKYHKPTFLLRYGKRATCGVSLTGLLLGGLLIADQLRHFPWLVAVLIAYIASTVFMLQRLLRSPEGIEEQLSIGVGAKMGNGLLVTLLCFFALKEENAQNTVVILTVLGLTVLFFANYFNFVRDPDKAVIGYKG